jgi:hypothetical protein
MDMKKIGYFIRNMYRVILVNPGIGRKVINLSQESPALSNTHVDELLKVIISKDNPSIEPDPVLQKMLEQRVISGRTSFLAKNSFTEFTFPFFTFRNIELKMAVVTLAIVITTGIGPAVNHPVNRNLSPFILADTLIDSSSLYIHPFDSVIGQQ